MAGRPAGESDSLTAHVVDDEMECARFAASIGSSLTERGRGHTSMPPGCVFQMGTAAGSGGVAGNVYFNTNQLAGATSRAYSPVCRVHRDGSMEDMYVPRSIQTRGMYVYMIWRHQPRCGRTAASRRGRLG